MEKTYAKALIKLSEESGADEKALVENLIAHLTREGRLKLLPRILTELKREKQGERTLAPTVEVASEAEASKALAEAKALGIEASKAVINPNLIRGWRARAGGRLVDHSSSNALVELYRQITR